MTTNADREELIGSAEVARWLGMSREQIWRLWKAGKLPGYKLDRHLRFAPRDIEAYLAGHRTGPDATPLSTIERQRESRRASRSRRAVDTYRAI